MHSCRRAQACLLQSATQLSKLLMTGYALLVSVAGTRKSRIVSLHRFCRRGSRGMPGQVMPARQGPTHVHVTSQNQYTPMACFCQTCVDGGDLRTQLRVNYNYKLHLHLRVRPCCCHWLVDIGSILLRTSAVQMMGEMKVPGHVSTLPT